MAGNKTVWFSLRLPKRALKLQNPGLEIEDASSEANFRRFVETHMKAYGEEADRKAIAMYKKDVREGVIDRDKMLIVQRKSVPLGCLSYEVLQKPESEKYILLANLGVAAPHQGRGIGRDVLCAVLNLLADDFGPGTLVLGDVRSGAKGMISILEKIGFKQTRRKPWFPADA